jgi:adenylosuccinate lyase
MLVYPERMLRNLHSTGGLVFSGQLLLDLVEAGVLREDAYRIVQRNAMQAWREEKNFRELVSADPEITSRVEKKTLDRAFDLNRQLRNVDKIFKRVFPKIKLASKASRPSSKPKKHT